jgi:hypothetical protein
LVCHYGLRIQTRINPSITRCEYVFLPPFAPFFLGPVVDALLFTSVLVIVVTTGSIVLEATVESGIVVPDTVLDDNVFTIPVLTTKDPDTCVETVACNITLSGIMLAETIDVG